MNKYDKIILKVFLSTLFCFIVVIGLCQSYKQLHKNAIVVDGHNSILYAVEDSSWKFDSDLSGKTQSDLQRMKKGGIDIQLFALSFNSRFPSAFADGNRQIDTLYSWVSRNPDKMMFVQTTKQLFQSVKQHKLGVIIDPEGGYVIENDLGKLDDLYKRGVRCMTLVNESSMPWITSARDEMNDTVLHQPKGLSDFGKQVVRRMNELGMLVDISHAGEQTFRDVINTTTKPIIASHSCVYNLCPVYFNLKDEQIKAIAKNGGMVMISFWPGMLDSSWKIKDRAFYQQDKKEIDSVSQSNPAGIDQYLNSKYKNELMEIDRIPLNILINHIDYIIKLVGTDYVGLGSSFDGMEALWQGLNGNGVLDYPHITEALLQRGYSKNDIEKFLGGNFIRVFKANMQ